MGSTCVYLFPFPYIVLHAVFCHPARSFSVNFNLFRDCSCSFCVHTVFFVFLLFPLFLFSQALEACSHHVCVYRIKINEPVLGEGLNFLLSVCSRTKQLLKRVKNV